MPLWLIQMTWFSPWKLRLVVVACARPDPAPVPDATPGVTDAAAQPDATVAGDAQNANECCPAECAQNVCTCMGEEIACCWLVPHPLCDNLCAE